MGTGEAALDDNGVSFPFLNTAGAREFFPRLGEVDCVRKSS